MHRPLSALLALSLLTMACSGGEAPKKESTGDQRDALVVAYQADADVLMEIVSQSASDGQIISSLDYGTLDSEFDCELKYKPALYKTWTWSEDGKIISVELRDDIKWSDGQPVTADDIAFAYELVADPTVASPRLNYVERMVPGKRPLVIDPTHLEFHFTEAYDRNTQAAHIGLGPVAKHVVQGMDRSSLRGSPYATNPLVTGRWKVATWDRNQRIVLEPNDKFTGPKEEIPKLKRVIYKVIPDYTTRLVELENGSVDFMEAIQVADADRLAKEHPEIKLHRRGWRFMDYVAWNSIDPEDYKTRASSLGPDQKVALEQVKPHALFADKGVRVALGKAIDVDKLIAELLTSQVTGEKYGKPAVGSITPALCNVKADDIARLPFDPSGAKAELEALGWKDTNADGVLDKGGVPFKFKLMTNSGNQRRAKAAIIIQALLKDIGIEMEIEQVESNTFFERLRKKDYEAALSGWSAGLFIDPTDMWHSGPQHEFNFTSYNNPEVDKLIDAGMHEPDPAKAAVIWTEMERLIYADQPYAFLYWMDEIDGIHERFQDVKIDILSSMRDLHTWWVPADKVKYPQ